MSPTTRKLRERFKEKTLLGNNRKDLKRSKGWRSSKQPCDASPETRSKRKLFLLEFVYRLLINTMSLCSIELFGKLSRRWASERLANERRRIEIGQWKQVNANWKVSRVHFPLAVQIIFFSSDFVDSSLGHETIVAFEQQSKVHKDSLTRATLFARCRPNIK